MHWRGWVRNASLMVVMGWMVGCAQDSAAQQSTSATQRPAGEVEAHKPAPQAQLGDPMVMRMMLPDVVEGAMPSVVGIATRRTVRGQSRGPQDPFFRGFGPFSGPPGGTADRVQQGQGSGVIVSRDGIILTNNHVIDGADEIEVSLSDGRLFRAKTVGTDPQSDMAILQLENAPADLVPLPFGDSDRLRLGESVVAIGNPFGLSGTVTLGIISAKGRSNMGIVDYEDFIQTDAAINPGNSGGALVNLRGELVGINTAILTRSGGYQGVGFAIPSNMAQVILENLMAHGKVNRGWIGVMIQDLTPELAEALGAGTRRRGVVVSDVQEQSPAQASGIQRGDVIVQFDGSRMEKSSQLRNAIALKAPGSTGRVTLVRDGQEMTVEIELGALPGQETRRAGQEPARSELEGLELAPIDDGLRARLQLPRGLTHGVVVVGVDPQSRGARMGLRQGDVVMEINRQPVRSVAEFNRSYQQARSRVLFLVYRQGATVYLTVTK
jgi:serine protease Do